MPFEFPSGFHTASGWPRPPAKPKPKTTSPKKAYPGPSGHPDVFGLHFPFDKGYDAASRRNAPKASDDDAATASGYFFRQDKPGDALYVWLEDITVDFTLNGEIGQSQRTRTFFPRSFNHVTVHMVGRVASTQEYNRLATFVREAQWDLIDQSTRTASSQRTTALLNFVLHDKTPNRELPGFHNPKRRTSQVTWYDTQNNLAPDDALTSTKGRHRPWQISGYIETVNAGAVKHEVAPEFALDFIVAESLLSGTTGIWGDSTDTSPRLLSDIDRLFTKSHAKSGFVSDGSLAGPTVQQTIKSFETSITQGIQDFVHAAGQLFS